MQFVCFESDKALNIGWMATKSALTVLSNDEPELHIHLQKGLVH